MEWMSWLQRHSNRLFLVVFLLFCVSGFTQDFGDFQFKKLGNIYIRSDIPVDEPFLRNLIELTPNVDILTRSKIRKSIELLYATGNFTNVLVDAQLKGERVELTFILHSIYRIEAFDIKGNTGVSKGKIRKAMRLRKFEPYTPERILRGRDDILAFLKEWILQRPCSARCCTASENQAGRCHLHD
jgi:hypothetical protein